MEHKKLTASVVYIIAGALLAVAGSDFKIVDDFLLFGAGLSLFLHGVINTIIATNKK